MNYRMKLTLTALVFALPIAAFAQTTIDNALGQYQDSRYHFVVPIVADGEAAYDQWKLTVTDKLPSISVRNVYTRGETANVFLLYKTKSVDSKGKANLTYNFKITKPNGAKKEYADLILGTTVPEIGFALVEQPIGWTFDDNDPFGTYVLSVTVKDALNGFTKSFDFKITLSESVKRP